MAKSKRYAAEIDFYVYAKDDDEAQKFLESICNEMKAKFDNRAKATKLVEIPFASLTPREVELKIA